MGRSSPLVSNLYSRIRENSGRPLRVQSELSRVLLLLSCKVACPARYNSLDDRSSPLRVLVPLDWCLKAMTESSPSINDFRRLASDGESPGTSPSNPSGVQPTAS